MSKETVNLNDLPTVGMTNTPKTAEEWYIRLRYVEYHQGKSEAISVICQIQEEARRDMQERAVKVCREHADMTVYDDFRAAYHQCEAAIRNLDPSGKK